MANHTLNENYNGKTPLRKFWPIVKSNFASHFKSLKGKLKCQTPISGNKKARKQRFYGLFMWSGLQDSNLRPLGPKPSALPNCAKPRQNFYIITHYVMNVKPFKAFFVKLFFNC